MAPHRRKDLPGRRRRVEDEGDEEGALEAGDLDDDSLSERSIISEDEDGHEDDELSPATAASAAAPMPSIVNGGALRSAKNTKPATSSDGPKTPITNGTGDMVMMLNGLKVSGQNGTAEEIHYDNLPEDEELEVPSPAVVTSTTQMDRPQELPHERRRREHEEYKKKRDADPAFVPNRGAFFMHDHRHAGPAANGFRPFGRGRGRGRPGIGGPYAPMNHMSGVFEPTDQPWAHDMHEAISKPSPSNFQTGYNSSGSTASSRIPVNAPNATPPNRALSTTKYLGKVQVRILLSTMEKPIVIPGIACHQYTRLPDHRPPLRRDKPVRISLPDHPPRYIFPAIDRSFIFIPRAMRPNQQGFGGRGRGRSGLGSVGGYSRRTSVFGGSVYGSAYTPSVAMSRRSSLARELSRDNLISPTGSAMSRPHMSIDPSRPVVKLPPASQSVQPSQPTADVETQKALGEEAVDQVPRPQTYPPPQKPTFRENRPNAIPMHQPRPQKAVSVDNIESPATLSFNPPQQHQQPFHQQVPMQVNGNGYTNDSMLHSRNPSYPSQASTGTPLSQIPERAIHAQPFQPNSYQQSQNYYTQAPVYPVMPPQGYYYPQQNFNQPMATSVGAAPFVPSQPQQPPASFPQSGQQQDSSKNLVAQEVNGMVYYYDPAQLPTVTTFPGYPPPQPYPMQPIGGQPVGGVVGMGGMMTPSPDGFYYAQAPPGVVYYPQ
ncbi:CASC3/Barentsz eIF4AIII binding-domain-containing protein [Bisporella sp. PMI_857]|nr:CASC3/Barentsz eIF4AIII binding-domain-containing protein [Bisporella sp. PMI_857]